MRGVHTNKRPPHHPEGNGEPMINFKDFKKEGNVKFKLSKVFPEPINGHCTTTYECCLIKLKGESPFGNSTL